MKKTNKIRLKVKRRSKCGVGRSREAFTHTFSGGDVNGAGDVREAFVHAHLQVDDPATQEVRAQLRL